MLVAGVEVDSWLLLLLLAISVLLQLGRRLQIVVGVAGNAQHDRRSIGRLQLVVLLNELSRVGSNVKLLVELHQVGLIDRADRRGNELLVPVELGASTSATLGLTTSGAAAVTMRASLIGRLVLALVVGKRACELVGAILVRVLAEAIVAHLGAGRGAGGCTCRQGLVKCLASRR